MRTTNLYIMAYNALHIIPYVIYYIVDIGFAVIDYNSTYNIIK